MKLKLKTKGQIVNEYLSGFEAENLILKEIEEKIEEQLEEYISKKDLLKFISQKDFINHKSYEKYSSMSDLKHDLLKELGE
jgi:hypothetical protein